MMLANPAITELYKYWKMCGYLFQNELEQFSFGGIRTGRKRKMYFH